MMPHPFKNALVTGGERRIGAAIVRELVDAGLGVAIHSRRAGEDADALVAEIDRDRTTNLSSAVRVWVLEECARRANLDPVSSA